MIRETIITTMDGQERPHIAPMGVTVIEDGYLIQPFRPSRTLDNLLARRCGVINFTDDVRVFAGCVTGRHREWPTRPATRIAGVRLDDALAHEEVRIDEIQDDPVRPRLLARVIHGENHAPFKGFNRAQAAVVEGAILASRLHMLPADKIDRDMAYLTIAIDKTAGALERQAWTWLTDHIAAFRAAATMEPSAATGQDRT